MIKLVPITDVKASEYNPRKNDEKRLALTEMSLRKLDLYYQMKRENGYTEEKIMQKRKSLENVLSPLKAEWNEDMLHEAGFEKVDMFWRCLNFCGWVAIK